ncbi:Diaminopimelate epimerase [bacterium HR21]|nr:Diaminopimelate epimerase [bacterium HR21]
MQLTVTYVSGSGNTFTLIREGRRRFPVTVWRQLAPQLCQWTDGLLVLGKPDGEGRVVVQFFNPDGSTGMLCGNGARCAAALLLGDKGGSVRLLFAGREVEATVSGRNVQLRMAPPQQFPRELSLELPAGRLRAWFADVGAPQLVVPVPELAAIGVRRGLQQLEVEHLGRQLRFHAAFAPTGTNVSFYQLAPEGTVEVRTYERGVERETQACGTAALAVALTAWVRDGLQPPVRVLPASRSALLVSWEGQTPAALQALFLEGQTEVLGTDTVEVTLGEEDEWE